MYLNKLYFFIFAVNIYKGLINQYINSGFDFKRCLPDGFFWHQTERGEWKKILKANDVQSSLHPCSALA